MGGDEPGVTGITQRELLLELREDIRGLKATVDAIARDQALGVERRAAMQRSADGILSRLDEHDRELDDLRRWRDRADGAMAGRLTAVAIARCGSSGASSGGGPSREAPPAGADHGAVRRHPPTRSGWRSGLTRPFPRGAVRARLAPCLPDHAGSPPFGGATAVGTVPPLLRPRSAVGEPPDAPARRATCPCRPMPRRSATALHRP